MNLSEFAQDLCRKTGERLGEDYHVELKEIRKNNGVTLQGMMISSREGNVVPTIYLEDFFYAYQEGMPFEEIMEVYGQGVPAEHIDMGFFKSFEKVRDRICCKLVRRDGNEELLKDVPYVEFLDLAVCFFYAFRNESLGEGSILIHNSHREMWGCTTEELMELARKNTPELSPWQCLTMEEVLKELEPEETVLQESAGRIPMKILTNSRRQNGAACLIDSQLLETIAQQENADLYILPSSVHEVILLREGDEEPGELRAMIAYVNKTQVAPEEVLSDSLYRYNRQKKSVEIVP